MTKIARGSAFDLANYQLKGAYAFGRKSDAELSVLASKKRERMKESADAATRAVGVGTVPGLGEPKNVPMHLARPGRKAPKP